VVPVPVFLFPAYTILPWPRSVVLGASAGDFAEQKAGEQNGSPVNPGRLTAGFSAGPDLLSKATSPNPDLMLETTPTTLAFTATLTPWGQKADVDSTAGRSADGPVAAQVTTGDDCRGQVGAIEFKRETRSASIELYRGKARCPRR
jgi:hypothetical protein